MANASRDAKGVKHSKVVFAWRFFFLCCRTAIPVSLLGLVILIAIKYLTLLPQLGDLSHEGPAVLFVCALFLWAFLVPITIMDRIGLKKLLTLPNGVLSSFLVMISAAIVNQGGLIAVVFFLSGNPAIDLKQFVIPSYEFLANYWYLAVLMLSLLTMVIGILAESLIGRIVIITVTLGVPYAGALWIYRVIPIGLSHTYALVVTILTIISAISFWTVRIEWRLAKPNKINHFMGFHAIILLVLPLIGFTLDYYNVVGPIYFAEGNSSYYLYRSYLAPSYTEMVILDNFHGNIKRYTYKNIAAENRLRIYPNQNGIVYSSDKAYICSLELLCNRTEVSWDIVLRPYVMKWTERKGGSVENVELTPTWYDAESSMFDFSSTSVLPTLHQLDGMWFYVYENGDAIVYFQDYLSRDMITSMRDGVKTHYIYYYIRQDDRMIYCSNISQTILKFDYPHIDIGVNYRWMVDPDPLPHKYGLFTTRGSVKRPPKFYLLDFEKDRIIPLLKNAWGKSVDLIKNRIILENRNTPELLELYVYSLDPIFDPDPEVHTIHKHWHDKDGGSSFNEKILVPGTGIYYMQHGKLFSLLNTTTPLHSFGNDSLKPTLVLTDVHRTYYMILLENEKDVLILDTNGSLVTRTNNPGPVDAKPYAGISNPYFMSRMSVHEPGIIRIIRRGLDYYYEFDLTSNCWNRVYFRDLPAIEVSADMFSEEYVNGRKGSRENL